MAYDSTATSYGSTTMSYGSASLPMLKIKSQQTTEALRDLCGLGGCIDVRSRNTVMRGLREYSSRVETTEWIFLFEAGFPSAVLDLILDEGFCSSTISQVLQWGVNPGPYDIEITYASDVVKIYTACMMNLLPIFNENRRCPILGECSAGIDTAVELALARSEELWSRLYEIRETLFSETFRDALLEERSFDTLLAVTAEALAILERHTNRIRPASCLSYMLFLFWINSTHEDAQHLALCALCTLLQTRHATDPATYSAFYLDATSTITTPEIVYSCIYRDFKSSTTIDQDLVTTLSVLFYLSSGSDPVTPVCLGSALDHNVFLYCLAAGRRQLCMGDIATDTFSDIFALIIAYVMLVSDSPNPNGNEPILLSESYLHGIIPILSEAFSISYKTGSSSGNVGDLIRLCSTGFMTYKVAKKNKRISWKLEASRWCTYKCWKRVLRDIIDTRRRPPHENARKENIVMLWRNLGNFLPMPSPSPDDPEERRGWWMKFGVLKRCAWEGCPCSEHTPVHPLKVCTRCWKAAYCGPRCQEADWEKGDHSRRCRSSRR